MAFDACMMRAVLSEFSREFSDAKIEKVLEPQSDEIDLVIHSGKLSRRLVFNVGPNAPRVQLSDIQKENPKVPPMFCMLLRKHLVGARIVSVAQPGFDRIAEFTLSCYDEMGYKTEKKLVCEIMGKYANLILLDSEDKIISAMKIIDFAASTVRQVIPGMKYQIPKNAEKLSPLKIDRAEFFRALAEFPSGRTAEKFITLSYSGIATQIAHEIVFLACGRIDVPVSEIDPDAFYGAFERWQSLLISESYTPTAVIDSEGNPKEYAYMPLTYLSAAGEQKSFGTLRELFDLYFAEKDRKERIRQRAHDLIRLLSNAKARTERKLSLQREALAESEKGEVYKKYGDLITENIYRLRRGMESFVATDYYDPDCPEIEIKLDSRLSPAQNGQKMYKLYNKAKNAKATLTEQIKLWERELEYLDGVQAFLERAEGEDDLSEIRDELYRVGYASRMKGYRPEKKPKIKYTEFISPSGYRVRVGRNNTQNDELSHKLAEKSDIWFHVKDIPGSHVIMETRGEEPEAEDYTFAASLAAYYSKAARGELVPVDYTAVKNLKKPQGSKPGFVTYKTNYTAYVKPSLPKEGES